MVLYNPQCHGNHAQPGTGGGTGRTEGEEVEGVPSHAAARVHVWGRAVGGGSGGRRVTGGGGHVPGAKTEQNRAPI